METRISGFIWVGILSSKYIKNAGREIKDSKDSWYLNWVRREMRERKG